MADITQYNLQIKISESGAEQTAKQVDKMSSSLDRLKSTIKGIGIAAALKSVFEKIKNCTLATSDYIETMNYFSASMGDATQKATEFIKKAEQVLGLDPKNLMDSISSFQNLGESLGIDSDRAYTMSQNLTQLAADLSSYRNISFEEAQRKLLSGFSGQVKPLREYGIALNQASLQETAYSLGLQQKVKDMTQAQKAELIYYQIMTSTTKMQGDLGRTLSSPANALRLMKAEFNKLAREIGNVFIPIMMKIIPVVIAVTEILLDGVKAIAEFFHIDIGDYKADTESVGTLLEGIGGGIEDIGDAAEDTTKKMNKMLMPFDELNNINSNTGTNTGLGAAGGIGGDLGSDLPEYDMFSNVSSQIRKEVDKIKEKIQELLPIIALVLLTLAGLFIFLKIKFGGSKKALETAGTGVDTFLTSLGKATVALAVLVGLSLVIESITHLIEAFSESGLDLKETLILIGGAIGIVVAAFAIMTAIMKNFQPSISSIAGSAVIFLGLTAILLSLSMVIEAVADSGMEMTDILTGIGGILAEIIIAAGVLVLLGEALQSPMAMAGVLLITLAIVALLYVIADTLPYILDAISIFIQEIGPTVIKIIETIGDVLDRVIRAIGEVLPPILEAIGNTFQTIFEGIATIVTSVGDAVSKVIETIGDTATRILEGVKDVIHEIGITIERVAHTIVWFFENIGPALDDFTDHVMSASTKMINFVISGVEYLVNRVVDGINALASKVDKVPGITIDKVQYVTIPRFKAELYKEGGFPETGQLFIANEAGPELIGNIGNKTAVANKEQITTAIANATYQAMSRALAENGQNDGQPIIVNVGNEQLYKGYTNYRNQQSNMYGINI